MTFSADIRCLDSVIYQVWQSPEFCFTIVVMVFNNPDILAETFLCFFSLFPSG